MADIAASVLARLKNKAAESGRADNLILKGDLFIYSVTNFDSRVTVDVDFFVENKNKKWYTQINEFTKLQNRKL